MSNEAGETAPVLTTRERRWLEALLVLGTCVVALVLLGLVSNILLFFADVLFVFFLAWLLAFVLSPVANAIFRVLPVLPRGVAVLITYGLLLVLLVFIVVLAAQSLADSIAGFVAYIPQLQSQIPSIVAPINQQLRAFGLQVDLVASAQTIVGNVASFSRDLARPLSDLALASVGALGNLVIILFLSLYIVLDRDRIVAFFVRIVPPQYADEVRLFERSVSRSFGGFLRGQAIMGAMFGAVAAVVGIVFGLDFVPVTAAFSGVLQAIPFFGPFVSWAPPVLVAAFTQPGALIPVIIIMVAAWMIVMNVVQPRLMADSVGIHPIVVLASVIVGIKVAGVVGAVFGIPVTAVLSSFFFYYLNRTSTDPRTVAARAARRLSEREGRPVRVPGPPSLTEVHRRADYPDTGTYSYPFAAPAGRDGPGANQGQASAPPPDAATGSQPGTDPGFPVETAPRRTPGT
jgi:predicted PurR-regulated permease PerM